MSDAGLKVLFLGTPQFAVPTLDAILASSHTVVGVVSQPDRPRRRGQRVSPSPVKQRALESSIPVLQPVKMKDETLLSALRALNADLGVVAAYGRILTDDILTIPRLGMINVHASLLPRYRGAAPVHRAIINGERETGVTIMRVVLALDAGPMMASTRRAIGSDETSEVVEQDLARLGASLLVTTVDALADGTATETPQNESETTYAHRLTKEEGVIDWTLPAQQLHNRVRGLQPWPHTQTTLKGHRLIVLRSSAVAEASTASPGTILSATGDDLRVATGDGALRILELQPEGKRPLTAREFLAGHRLTAGDCFGT